MKILLTGGAGFIGSALIRHLIDNTDHQVLNVDKLTYAGNLESRGNASQSSNYQFVQVSLRCSSNEPALCRVPASRRVHLVAESHVERSIDGNAAFIETNILRNQTDPINGRGGFLRGPRYGAVQCFRSIANSFHGRRGAVTSEHGSLKRVHKVCR